MKRLALLLVVAIIGAVLLWGAEPWKAKKYTEWTDKEADRILKNSPWAREVPITLGQVPAGGGGRGGRGGGGRGGGGGMGGGGGTGAGGAMPSADPGMSGGGEMERQGAGGGGGGMPETSGAANPNAAVLVRWQSALPIRQAIMRKQILLGKIDQEKADAALKTALNVYAIALSGLPMPLMRQALAAPDKVKSASFLRPGNGEPIPAQQCGQSRANQAELMFIFPRTSNIGLDDKNVEFETALGPLHIKKKFAIKDMVFDGKPEM